MKRSSVYISCEGVWGVGQGKKAVRRVLYAIHSSLPMESGTLKP